MIPCTIQTERLSAEALNRDCHCVSVDMARLRGELSRQCGSGELCHALLDERPHLFAAPPVFLSRRHAAHMAEVITAVEEVVALPAYQEAVLARAPDIARHDPGPRGVFLGYDFHLTAEGAQLIEINTNAGGAMLNAILARAADVCCAEVEGCGRGNLEVEAAFLAMFREEWRRQRDDVPLVTVAIVDASPRDQYLYPEFLLFRELFKRAGYEALIVDPGELHYAGGRLMAGDRAIDLVYNRLTDFDLDELVHEPLRRAHLDGKVVLTPSPRHHALYADKHNLALLGDEGYLEKLGVAQTTIAMLRSGIPATLRVTRENADRLWAERRRFFFKPAGGFGSRGAYRGEKLTRRVWENIVAGDYVAQAYVPPTERVIRDRDAPLALKVDFRNYVYGGEVQLLAARLYQGQTTNFRTPGGGFAPVFTA